MNRSIGLGCTDLSVVFWRFMCFTHMVLLSMAILSADLYNFEAWTGLSAEHHCCVVVCLVT